MFAQYISLIGYTYFHFGDSRRRGAGALDVPSTFALALDLRYLLLPRHFFNPSIVYLRLPILLDFLEFPSDSRNSLETSSGLLRLGFVQIRLSFIMTVHQ